MIERFSCDPRVTQFEQSLDNKSLDRAARQVQIPCKGMAGKSIRIEPAALSQNAEAGPDGGSRPMQLLRNGASRLVAGEVQQNPVVLRGPSQVRAILALHLFSIDHSKLCGMPPDGMRVPVRMALQQFANCLPLSAPSIPVTFAQDPFIFTAPYLRDSNFEISAFDFSGRRISQLPARRGQTMRLAGVSSERDEVFLETESFTEPVSIHCHSVATNHSALWARRSVPLDSSGWECERVSYPSRDGTEIPIHLAGRRDARAGGSRPSIMTSHGGYGVSMTPQFSVFVAFLVERGCLFALPSIRGGSEFGEAWHAAAKRRNRQTAYDDFLAAAEWLVATGRTAPGKLAIFGGSNSGTLVAAAMTQRPELFRAVVSIAPMLDMLRYHLFDGAHVWREEFGTAEDADDFAVLRGYSPYHQITDGTAYPATMIVSGDADQNCHPLHARKMTARLQAANSSGNPVFLDYSRFRGHSPVLPLSDRVQALTERMAFLCEQLGIEV